MLWENNVALLVIDVQRGFDEPCWGTRNNINAEENIGRLIAIWRQDGRPIYHVFHASTSSQGVFTPGTVGYEVKSEAKPVDGEPVYIKKVNSAFIGTNLEKDLKFSGIKTLVVVGFTTNHCVSTTVRMASNLGFVVYLVADATATYPRKGLNGEMRPAEEVHAAALSDLSEEFATIVETETIEGKVRLLNRSPR